MFVLCLDQGMPSNKFPDKNYESVGALRTMTGISSDTNAGNRWHDKAVQVRIV